MSIARKIIGLLGGVYNLFAKGGTTGGIVVRQPGGTPGTDEVQISHDGTYLQIANQDTTQENCVLFGLAANIKFGMRSISNGSAIGATGNILVYAAAIGIAPGQDISTSTVAAGNSLYTFSTVGIGMSAAQLVGWSSGNINLGSTYDTCLYRNAAGVVGVGKASAATFGWIQNSAGNLALASNFTDVTGTLAATNFSFPVISGRTYKITGFIAGNNSTGTEGFQMSFSGVAATAILFEIENTGLGTVVLGTQSSAAIDTAVTATTFTNGRLRVTGYVQPSASGNLVVKMAEVSHAAGTLTINANSWINLEDCRAV